MQNVSFPEAAMPSFVRPEDPLWADSLARCPHDFYALPCFAALDASWSNGEAVAYIDRENNILIPLVRRALSYGYFDATSPYGYPGIVTNALTKKIRNAIERYLEAGQKAGLVTSFLRLHPLLNANIPHALSGLDSCMIVEHGPTVSVSLAEEDENWLAQLPKGLRRDIRVLQREGYVAEFNGPDALNAFMDCYHASMKRREAADTYLFDQNYLEQLTECLGARITVCVVRSAQGEPACAGLFTCVNRIAQYHLSGTNPSHLSLGPNKLMLTAARKWAREQGAQWFHLGGGVGAREDGLFAFKRRFGSHLSSFWTLRLIHDRDLYENLRTRWLQRNNLTEAPNPNFFPVYRQQVCQ